MSLFLLSLGACAPQPARHADATDAPIDADGDGWRQQLDCDDADPSVHVNAREICNDRDDDCDLLVDEYLGVDWFGDADGDGYGVLPVIATTCAQPPASSADRTDCDDGESRVYPDAPESCDGFDENCNGVIDEGIPTAWYADPDGDGYGSGPDLSSGACEGPTDSVPDGTDCDEANPDIHPYADEVCRDGIDQDCNGGDDCSLEYADHSIEGGTYFGYSVATGGDVTGDGLPDILVGMPSMSENDDIGYEPGMTYLFRASRLSETRELEADSAAGWILTGEWAHPGSGYTVSFVPDVDEDGLDEVAISAVGWYPSGADGRVYLVLGASLAAGREIGLMDADCAFAAFVAPRVGGGADFDGDGRGDLLMFPGAQDGVPPTVAQLFAGSSLARCDGEMEEPPVLVSGDAVLDGGAWAGDVDGDGLDDLVLADDGDARAGTVWGFSAASLASATSLTVEDADWATTGLTGDAAGHSLSAVGDLDGDGLDDVLVGAVLHVEQATENLGAAYVVLARSLEAGAPASFADADLTIVGRYDMELVGYAVSAAGDFDGDGHVDLLIGAPGYDGALYGEGRACLFSGADISFPAVLEISQADICLPGDQSGIAAGMALDGGADINGDGLDDLLIGAPFASTYDRAKTYVVFGE